MQHLPSERRRRPRRRRRVGATRAGFRLQLPVLLGAVRAEQRMHRYRRRSIERRKPAVTTWEDTIRVYFTDPTWLPESERASIAAGWNAQMTKLFQLELTDYDIVRSWAVTIYYHLHSRSMPLTDDERQFFPDDVLETFRSWVNEGCRRSAADPIVHHQRIPPPRLRPVPLAVRKNILELSEAELLSYRLAVEGLGATTYPTSPDVPWQRIAYLHTDWCLHYQEAFLLWHRACLLYFESQLGLPVPYWNWMSPRIADDGDPAAGLPRASPMRRSSTISVESGQTRCASRSPRMA